MDPAKIRQTIKSMIKQVIVLSIDVYFATSAVATSAVATSSTVNTAINKSKKHIIDIAPDAFDIFLVILDNIAAELNSSNTIEIDDIDGEIIENNTMTINWIESVLASSWLKPPPFPERNRLDADMATQLHIKTEHVSMEIKSRVGTALANFIWLVCILVAREELLVSGPKKPMITRVGILRKMINFRDYVPASIL